MVDKNTVKKFEGDNYDAGDLPMRSVLGLCEFLGVSIFELVKKLKPSKNLKWVGPFNKTKEDECFNEEDLIRNEAVLKVIIDYRYNYFKLVRTARGMSSEEFSKELGIKEDTLCAYENGRYKPENIRLKTLIGLTNLSNKEKIEDVYDRLYPMNKE